MRTLPLRSFLLLVMATSLIIPMNAFSTETAADCAQTFSYSAKDSYKANPSDVEQCIKRGYSPPKTWKRDGGQNSGVKAGGARGFSYGNVQAPPDSPGAVGVNASVTKEVIQSSCSFPPRIKLGIPPTVSFPAGSCMDFLQGIFKDVNGKGPDAVPIAAISPDDHCPAESDMLGIFGAKESIAKGSSAVRQCGGMVPISTTEMVLNPKATEFAATENGAYYIWINQRNAGSGTYTAVTTAHPLPTYLCTLMTDSDGNQYWQKTADLTPPIAQMITYDRKIGHLSIKLQSRETMPANFIPGYTEGEPERYLIIPINSDGQPNIPKDCDDEATYFQTLTSREDIRIQSGDEDSCFNPAALPTTINNPTYSYDAFGNRIPGSLVNHWTTTCPDGSTVLPCPQPAATACTEPESQQCDMVTIYLKEAVCPDKTQYGVLNRPNLYYPPGSTTRVWPISGRTTLLADTVDGNELYTSPRATYTLRPTAAPLKLTDGGSVAIANGQTLMMNPTSIIDAATNTVTLMGGGQRLSLGGRIIEKFDRGKVYTIPSNLLSLPLQVSVDRSVALPAGYTVPTMPQKGTTAPYIRLPITKPK